MHYLFLTMTLCSGLMSYSQHSYKIIASTIQRDLIPEGIAVDQNTGFIYISSIAHHKIVILDSNRNHRDFIKEDQDGYLEGLGMKIDDKRKWIWAVSNTWGKMNTAQLHAFELSSGKMKKHFTIKDTARHGFNDLVLMKKGKFILRILILVRSTRQTRFQKD